VKANYLVISVFVCAFAWTSGTYGNEGSDKISSVALTPVKGVAASVGEIGRGAEGFVKETVAGTVSGRPIAGTIEGVGKGSGVLVESAVKSAYRVATLGFGEAEEVIVVEPERDTALLDPTESEPTKFKVALPW